MNREPATSGQSGRLYQFALRDPSPEESFYYHFRGLNTNWRPEGNFGEEVESFDASRHVPDTLIGELFIRAGLNDDHGLPSPPTGQNSAREP